MRALGVVAFAVVMATACASVDLTPHGSYRVDAKLVEYKDVTFKAGDHVMIKSIAGTFKPVDTGHAIEVRAEPGRTGIVLGGVKRKDPVTPGEPIQIVLIRFDEQVWRDTSSSGAEVKLKPFEATIHADYVAALKK